MASQPEIFDVSGPLHLLTSFDWSNTSHQRSLAASLVQGVYSLEHVRQGSIKHDDASPWWERFNYNLERVLEDDHDSSWFGAIFKLRFTKRLFHRSRPKYIIAFRGTLLTKDTRSEDIKLNLKSALAELEESSRFKTALEAVCETVVEAGTERVWLAGHSLGASIAMLAGKNLAMSGCHLETYLFNPPFISVPLERMIKNKTLKRGIRVTCTLIKAGIVKAMNILSKEPEEGIFNVISEWKPYVFVNPKDIICAEYIGYFEHREIMEKMGVGNLARIGTKYSFRCLVSRVCRRDVEPLHIVPTAYMTVNRSPSKGFRQHHGIVQWWQPDNQWQPKLYDFKTL